MLKKISVILSVLFSLNSPAATGDFESFLKPLFSKSCVSCHGKPRPGKKPKIKGKINLFEITTEKGLLNHPKVIKEMIEAIDANDMPPEDEPQLTVATKEKLILSLKIMLQKSTEKRVVKKVNIHRLNRFQYNNIVKDLFRLNRDIFNLPEKLMTRKSSYLQNVNSGKMPVKVDVVNNSFNKTPVFKGVEAFPQDLRANHGYDNQANNLTLSPLLLDSFLTLSMSIISSPDFNPGTVGIWNDLFAEPKDKTNVAAEMKARLKAYLSRAFRRPVDEKVLTGYTSYAMSRMRSGLSFTDSMKKAVIASLSSPLFLYKHSATTSQENEYTLASKLSFMLWGSAPDEELMKLAKNGLLSKSLPVTIDRMMQDPKIERFLDSFPSQWMQLNAILDAKPNPKDFKLYSLDKERPAAVQLVLEPLLLFDTVYMENRPIVELINPSYGYSSKYLKLWYGQDKKLDPKLIAEDRALEKKRHGIDHKRHKARVFVGKAKDKVKKVIINERKKSAGKMRFVNIKPYSSWDFNGDLNDSFNKIKFKAFGKVSFKDGMIVLKDAYLQGDAREHFKERTFDIKFKLNATNKNGGGLVGMQDIKNKKKLVYDSLVFGKKQPQHWLADSSGDLRTKPFGGTAETKVGEMIHLVVSYHNDGSVEMYRNGQPYGKRFKAGKLEDYHRGKGAIFLGISDLTGKGQKLNVSIDSLRIYRRHISGNELKAIANGANEYISDGDLLARMEPQIQAQVPVKEKEWKDLEAQLKRLPPHDHRQRKIEAEFKRALNSHEFVRVPQKDPRYGGIITNAALMVMTSTSKRTRPIGRGAWIIEVILNDPPPPPPNDIPALNEDDDTNLTIRETFAKHRESPDCAGCHAKLDPLGFAMENFNPIGLWRDKYKKNKRDVDPHGTLLRKHDFKGIVDFKEALVKEEKRFAKAFTAHLLRFALSRELNPGDSLTVEKIINKVEKDQFKMRSIIREVILSESFLKM